MLARRLSNAEYDYTIRDLTGVDLRPTRQFPVDPANQEGFDNSGESLSTSPALMKKYLQAARHVADHLVLKPAGFDFAPEPLIRRLNDEDPEVRGCLVSALARIGDPQLRRQPGGQRQYKRINGSGFGRRTSVCQSAPLLWKIT